MLGCSGRSLCSLRPVHAPPREVAGSIKFKGVQKGRPDVSIRWKGCKVKPTGANGRGRGGEGVMADWDPSSLEGSNCSLLCYNPHRATHSKNTEGRSGYHRERVRVCVRVHINTAAVIWKLCTRIHTWGVWGWKERGRADGMSWALHFEAVGGNLGRHHRLKGASGFLTSPITPEKQFTQQTCVVFT